MTLKQNELAQLQSKLLVVTKGKKLPEGEIEAVLSTDDLDRHGERVSIKGVIVPKDQVIKMYYNHETYGDKLPIGKWLRIWKINGKLMGHGVFDLEDDFALKVYKKVSNGFIDSISIGFYPQEYDGESSTWTKSTLVEASIVAEPANVNAVITSKQLGFTQDEFKESLTVKLKSSVEPDSSEPPEEPELPEDEQIEVKRLVKGAVEDTLTSPKKWELMKPYYDVIYAFEEAFYNSDTDVTEFTKLLNETIEILKTISAGTYSLKSAISGDGLNTEVESAIEELKSRVGAVEVAQKATTESPAIKDLIRVRVAVKQVDKAAEDLNRILRIKLKEQI